MSPKTATATVRVKINSVEVEVPADATALQALRLAGFDVPSACYDPRLKPFGACRQCLVRVDGNPKPVTSCSLPLREGMEIDSESPEVKTIRQAEVSMLAQRFPKEALIKNGSAFARTIKQLGLESETGVRPRKADVDDSHPYISVDMSKCIYCYRCVRICDEVQGQSVWQIQSRGDEVKIVADTGVPFGLSSCVSCGACVDTCPTGALEDKSVISMGAPTKWTKTTCPYCGVGCELEVGTKDGKIVTNRPAKDSPVNKGHLCVKGRYATGYVSSPDRITSPMIRRNGEWETVSWDEAIAHCVSELNRISEAYGPDSIGVLGSARGTNEENYVAQKFARVVVGTNNVDCCARVCHAPSAAGLRSTLGTGAATSSFDDIERTHTIVLTGTNSTENHPVVGARIKQAARNGTNLVVIDPRKIELSHYAKVHLQIRPGTNIPIYHTLAHIVIEEGLCNMDFIGARTSEFEAFKEHVKDWTAERGAQVCGVDAEDIRRAARIIADGNPTIFFHGLGVTEHHQGTEGVMCIVNLAMLTGNIGKPGTGVNPLRGQNNVQGSAHMGCEPSKLAGMVDIDENRDRFEAVWGTEIPKRPGLNLMKMIDKASEGGFKAMWTIGYDVYLSNANMDSSDAGFGNMELVIIQDLFLNETAKKYGTVFLPACTSFEKDGTFMNSERRVNRVRKAIDPMGEAKADWEIVCEIARAMGKGEYFPYQNAEEIWEEVRKVWKPGTGISYARLEGGGLQWPCPSEDHPGTPMLHVSTFPHGDRASFKAIPFLDALEETNDEFPMMMITGRHLFGFNAGTMTNRTRNLHFQPTDLLDVNPFDADRLRLVDGDKVRIRSRYGEAVLPVRITNSVKPGDVFTTFHTPELEVNRTLSPHRDRIVNTPEFKLTAVELTKI